MAIDTLSGLTSAVADWLNREDLSARIPDFIQFAENRLNRSLRVSDMETTASLSLVGGAVALPADFLEARRIISTATGAYQTALIPLSPSQAGDFYPSSRSGVPIHYTISGNTLTTYPNAGTGPVTVSYYAAVPPLAIYGTNWLLAKAPDCYLYGALMEASPFVGDDQRTETWATLFQRGLEDLRGADQRSRYSSSACRVLGANP